MLTATFVLSGLILVSELATSLESVCRNGKTTCQCGTSDTTFSISCIDDDESEHPCRAFEHCETCENNVVHCLTCPRGYSGPFCDQEVSHSELDTHHSSDTENSGHRLVPRGLSCSELRAPKLGSISCWYRGYEKECTGSCLPGHKFESGVKEIKLVCQSGAWVPYYSFPPCISEGYCKFDLNGGGSYNCTFGHRGTYCDITCYGRGHRPVFGRYFCYPGESWSPPLPYCAEEKATEDTGDYRHSCECQNGGSCGPRYRQYQECTCPPGFRGRLCETRVRNTRIRCSHPGEVQNGEIKNTDGSIATLNQEFYEGSSVVYSCNHDFALVGDSLLTCTKSGSWSRSPPKCNSLNEPKTESPDNNLVYCDDPGVDQNGIKTVSPWINSRRSNSGSGGIWYPQGTQISYSCKEDYSLEGESSLICLYSGYWSAPIPKCHLKPSAATESPDDDLVYCEDPGVDQNGIKTVSPWINPRRSNSGSGGTRYPQGTQISYSCKEGYHLDGENSLTCLYTGYWSAPIPKCRLKSSAATREAAFCENPDYIRNGRKIVMPFIDPRTRQNVLEDSADLPEGVKLVFSCNPGFSITGNNIIECQSTGTWSSAVPTCKKQEVKACGHSYYTMTGKILHGEKTVEGEWPWQVAYAENRRNGMTITCGAVLINHRTALTAAHCILERRLDKTYLYFGKYYADFSKDDDQVVSRKATEFIVHPMYNRRNMNNDIAMVRFAPEVQYTTRIQPICLPTRDTTSQNLADGVKGWVTGWGTTENGSDSDILLMAQLPVVSTTRCRDVYRSLNLAVHITDNMYCAGFENGEVDSCSGDSGGPMVFYNRRDESYVLEGLVSFGVKGPTGSCGQQDRYGVYTKVSNYLQWLKQYM